MSELKNKIEEIKSNPEKLFGLIYPYILIIIITVGLYFVTNLGNIARQNVPMVPPDTTRETDLSVIEPRTIPPVDIMEVSKPTQELIAQGKETYTTICASCHGAEGTGDGSAAAGLNPQPRNFTIIDGWKNSPKLSGIYATLEEGIPNSGMIAYNYLPPWERIALAHYIRETFVPSPPADTENELMALDQLYSLSQGKEIPAQIPVKTAMSLILQENKLKVQELTQKLSAVDNSGEPGAKLFNLVTSNKFRALVTLNSDVTWKGNYQKFVESIVYNVNNNGFNNNIFKLTSDEWDTLYNYMNGLF